MDPEAFEDHLLHPRGRERSVEGAHAGAAGGAICGDLIRLEVRVDGDCVTDVGYRASGCGAIVAAGSAVVALVRGTPVLDAARVGTAAIAAELGGLSPGKLHAADLAADALHSALGAAVAADASHCARRDRTLVAMSGGVDSAVAALLVARDGREAVGVTVELWRDPENDAEASCCSASAVRTARAVAHGMGMAHLTLDLRDEFRAGVVEPWLARHREGETPNPCVACNGHVRLDAMLALADRLGAADLATGHYARHSAAGRLRAAVDPAKDQTYMLAALDPRSLARMSFPLGELRKPAVRALAAEAQLPVAHTPDSQDLCFLAGTGRAAFLARHGGLREQPGDIIDADGEVLGRHTGHHGFTVGQRKGIGLAAPEPLFVIRTDARANTVTVGPKRALQTSRVRVRGARLHAAAEEVDTVRLRYHAPTVGCRVQGSGARLELALESPVDGAAPGQLACLMRGDEILGWATIDSGVS